MKFNCLIDTSSYLNLASCEFSTGTLLNFLTEKVKIQFSPEVNYEINKHQNDTIPQTNTKYKERIPTSIDRSAQVYIVRKHTYPEYERRLWGAEKPRESGNKGEKHNLSATVDHFLKNSTKGLVYLIDDRSALRSFLDGVIDAFPVFQIWNSLDVVLYLYMDHSRFTLEMAQSAIKDMDAKMATDNDRMDHEKTQARIRTRTNYLKYLDRISTVKKR